MGERDGKRKKLKKIEIEKEREIKIERDGQRERWKERERERERELNCEMNTEGREKRGESPHVREFVPLLFLSSSALSVHNANAVPAASFSSLFYYLTLSFFFYPTHPPFCSSSLLLCCSGLSSQSVGLDSDGSIARMGHFLCSCPPFGYLYGHGGR